MVMPVERYNGTCSLRTFLAAYLILTVNQNNLQINSEYQILMFIVCCSYLLLQEFCNND